MDREDEYRSLVGNPTGGLLELKLIGSMSYVQGT